MNINFSMIKEKVIQEKVEQALQLLSLAKDELSVREAMDIIRGVSKLNEVVSQTLALGENRGIIKRENNRIFILSREPFSFNIVKRECSANCKRCGKRIKICHFVVIEGQESGPYGSDCIKFISK